jgi:probable addiction module antidote protein
MLKDLHDVLSDDLRNPDFVAVYLQECLKEGQDAFLMALRDVARANGVSKIARHAAIGREGMYKALSKTGNPRWNTVSTILEAVGLSVTFVPTSKAT